MNRKLIGLIALLILFAAAVLPARGLAQPAAAPQFTNCGLLTNLVSYWKLDEASGNAIDSVGTNTLTANNAPGSTTGKVNGARTFDGNHQFFSIPTNPSVEIGSSSFTFVTWATISNTTNNQSFVGKQTENGLTHIRDYGLYYDSGFQSFVFQASPDGTALTRTMPISFGVPLTNTWYFLAGGYDLAQSKIWISVNGGAKTTTDFSGAVHIGSAPFELGAVNNPLFGFESGLMDEVGFWKRSLTDAEITALYNSGNGLSYDFGTNGCPTPTGTSTATASPTATATATRTATGTITKTPTPTLTSTATSTRTQGPSPTPTQPSYSCSLATGLISYWKLDEASGDAIDSVGANTLAANNAPGSAAGIVNGARTFSGDHQYFSIPTNATLETGAIDFSFSAWVNMSDKSGNRAFIGKQIEDDPTHIRDYSIYMTRALTG